MGTPAAQAAYGNYYSQQPAAVPSEANGGQMVPMGMMWTQQQQMPPGNPQQEAQYAPQQPYAM